MPTNDAYRTMLERPEMTDKEVNELRIGIQAFIGEFLDDYFREEFEPDVE